MPSVTKPCLATGSRPSLSTVQTTLLAQYVVEVDIQPTLNWCSLTLLLRVGVSITLSIGQ